MTRESVLECGCPLPLLVENLRRKDDKPALQKLMPTATPNSAPPPGEVSQVVEHLFRHEAGKMVAILTRIFGIEHLALAEDVVQEALVRALQTWPFYGVPENPAAWKRPGPQSSDQRL